MFRYAVKRISRSGSIFLALFLSVALAATLFSGILHGADTVGVAMLDKAFEALQMSIDLGYCDFPYMAKDPDLKNLRHDKRYKKFLSQYRESPPC